MDAIDEDKISNGCIAKAASELLDAIDTAGAKELAAYFAMVGITGACFTGGVIEVFQEQLKAVAGRLAIANEGTPNAD